MMNAVDLTSVFAAIHTHWDPHIAAELNGQYVKCVKFKGEFFWHKHDQEDELFMVHRGEMALNFRDRVVRVLPGQFCVVPRGVEHKPQADNEVEVVLFEPASTLNTGNVRNELTKDNLKRAKV
jgi:mannose-6-phosphate isomerase-like protein (cupin superfamily)